MTKRTPTSLVGALVGFLMVAVGSPCVVAMIHDIFTKTDNVQGALLVGGFMGFVAVAGLALMWTNLRRPPAPAFVVHEGLERQVLQLARQHGGRVTVAEVALETDLTLDQVERLLHHFEQREVARTHLSDGGDIVYVFPGLTVDKAAAINPLDDRAVFDASLDESRAEGEDEVAFAHPQESKAEDW